MRLRTDPVGRYAAPPDELADRIWIEEWIVPGEPAPSYWSLTWDEWAQAQAWRRWNRARTAWLDQHGVPRPHQCQLIPYRRPVWVRDLPDD